HPAGGRHGSDRTIRSYPRREQWKTGAPPRGELDERPGLDATAALASTGVAPGLPGITREGFAAELAAVEPAAPPARRVVLRSARDSEVSDDARDRAHDHGDRDQHSRPPSWTTGRCRRIHRSSSPGRQAEVEPS